MMKLLGLLFFGSAIPCFILGFIYAPEQSPLWILSMLSGVICVVIIGRFCTKEGEGPGLRMSGPEWFNELARRQAGAQDFRTDEELEQPEPEPAKAEPVGNRMGFRVRLPR